MLSLNSSPAEMSDPYAQLADRLFSSLLEQGIIDDPKLALAFSGSFAYDLKQEEWLLKATEKDE